MEDTATKEEVVLDSDVIYSNFKICEGKEEKRPGVLCTIEGPFMFIGEYNNNDRLYTLSLVENKILGAPYTVRMLGYNSLLGEGRHPKDRFEIWYTDVSHCITDLWISEDKKTLMGRADILDTPVGRILYTLVRYGSVLGVSARASGKGLKTKEGILVDEKTYIFKTFDFVTNPGFVGARVHEKESSMSEELNQNIDIYDSMKELIMNESTTSEMKGILKTIIMGVDSEKLNDLLPMLEEEKSTTVTHDTTDIIDSMKGEIESLEEDLSALSEEAEGLRYNLAMEKKQNLALNQVISRMTSESELSVERLDESLSSLKDENKVLMEERDSLRDLLNLKTARVRSLNEERKALQSEYDALFEEHEDLKGKLENLNEEAVTKPKVSRPGKVSPIVQTPKSVSIQGDFDSYENRLAGFIETVRKS